MKKKFQRVQIQTGAAHELLIALDRFVFDRPIDSNEELHFEEIPLTEYALASAIVGHRTALHKVLFDLAYVEFFLYPYDDAEFAPDLVEEFISYVSWMFREMGKILPPEFSSPNPDVVRRARDVYSKTFVDGLYSIVDSAFALAWPRKTLLLEFNRKLASRVRALKKADHPILETDGRLPRVSRFPSWLVNAIERRDVGLCQHCGDPVASVFGSEESPHIDHMVALALGGGNDPTNLLLSCGSCNLSKGARKVAVKDEFSWPNARP